MTSTSNTPGTPISAKIAQFAGDGVGPDIAVEARKVLDAITSRFGHTFSYDDMLVGGIAIDAYGEAVRDEDVEVARNADGVLLGAVGGPKWDDPNASVRPEQGLLKLRKSLGLFANLRPVAVMEQLVDATPLKPEYVRGTDLIVVRELTGGLYFGQPSKQWADDQGRIAVDTMQYRDYEIERVVRLAFDLARTRRKKLTSVDKANVLSTSRLWRTIVTEIAPDYPDVELEHMLVDVTTMRLLKQPSEFDVIVTENTFGDIITDEASVLGGSLGLMPSASLGEPDANGRRSGMYEPIHGSAPRHAGTGRANPT
ncbi:MAG TPA: 3-isopropylmalate dehydrogenase, partial [Thermomicrobiales bacterium]|nr:3-isopropylmalate dehydrogenase [Thermomicrobiales bacterium]